jgi:uncharacterized protein
LNILLTGSSGLIGTALIDRLSGEGHRATRLVRGTPSHGGRAIDVGWDPDRGAIDVTGLERAGPFDGVVHLAGAGIGDKRWSAERKATILESRIESTRLLVDALGRLSTPPPTLVSASAVGWYGDRGDEMLTEASTPGTGFLAEVCQAWEAAAQPAAQLGIRTVHLRTGVVISGTGGALGKQLPLFRLGLGGRMGTGQQYRSWIALDDEVSVILRCLGDAELRGPVNATAPHPVTDGDLARSLGAALKRPSVVAVPAVALRVALGREMADELVLGGQRVLPAALQSVGYEFAHAHLDDAVRAALMPVV